MSGTTENTKNLDSSYLWNIPFFSDFCFWMRFWPLDFEKKENQNPKETNKQKATRIGLTTLFCFSGCNLWVCYFINQWIPRNPLRKPLKRIKWVVGDKNNENISLYLFKFDEYILSKWFCIGSSMSEAISVDWQGAEMLTGQKEKGHFPALLHYCCEKHQ